eukprot:300571-Chlamydomonas_euryale.AAC.22
MLVSKLRAGAERLSKARREAVLCTQRPWQQLQKHCQRRRAVQAAKQHEEQTRDGAQAEAWRAEADAHRAKADAWRAEAEAYRSEVGTLRARNDALAEEARAAREALSALTDSAAEQRESARAAMDAAAATAYVALRLSQDRKASLEVANASLKEELASRCACHKKAASELKLRLTQCLAERDAALAACAEHVKRRTAVAAAYATRAEKYAAARAEHAEREAASTRRLQARKRECDLLRVQALANGAARDQAMQQLCTAHEECDMLRAQALVNGAARDWAEQNLRVAREECARAQAQLAAAAEDKRNLNDHIDRLLAQLRSKDALLMDTDAGPDAGARRIARGGRDGRDAGSRSHWAGMSARAHATPQQLARDGHKGDVAPAERDQAPVNRCDAAVADARRKQQEGCGPAKCQAAAMANVSSAADWPCFRAAVQTVQAMPERIEGGAVAFADPASSIEHCVGQMAVCAGQVAICSASHDKECSEGQGAWPSLWQSLATRAGRCTSVAPW